MSDPSMWSRWPLLAGAAGCVVYSVRLLERTDNPDDGRTAAAALLVFAAFLLGGFLVDWGRRWQQQHKDEKPQSPEADVDQPPPGGV